MIILLEKSLIINNINIMIIFYIYIIDINYTKNFFYLL